MTTTTEPDVRRGSGEIALWWVAVLVASFLFAFLGLAIALVGSFTRLRAHHVQRVTLPVAAVLVVVVSFVLSFAAVTMDGEVTEEVVVPDAGAAATP
jgi:hypothetical protein